MGSLPLRSLLTCLFMGHVPLAKSAVFFKLKLISSYSLILRRCIVPSFALCTCKSHVYSGHLKLLDLLFYQNGAIHLGCTCNHA
jgi:hypothetical protein